MESTLSESELWKNSTYESAVVDIVKTVRNETESNVEVFQVT